MTIHRSLASAMAVVLLTTVAPVAGAAQSCRGRTATIVGTSGVDTINGTNGIDVIAALGGNDVIDGISGGDFICGGGGDDSITPGTVFDSGEVDGGAGSDTVVDVPSVDLGSDGRTAGSVATRLFSIENAKGTSGGDFFAGGPGANVITGGGGPDVFWYVPSDTGDDIWDGGEGIDRANYLYAPAGVTADLTAGTAIVPGTGTGTDSLAGIEELTGSWFTDDLTGSAEANVISDQDGWSGGTIRGQEGDDGILASGGSVIVDGGPGLDRISVWGSDGTVVDGGDDRDVISAHGAAWYPGAATYSGGAGSDSLTGSAMDDTLSGGSGGDDLAGGVGNDSLDGGADPDSGVGGPGQDTCSNIEAPVQGGSECASEFEADTSVGPAPDKGPEADVSISVAADGRSSDGSSFYLVTVSNAGPDAVDPSVWLMIAGRGVVPQDNCIVENVFRVALSCGTDLLGAGESESIRVQVAEAPKEIANHGAVVVTGSNMRDPNFNDNAMTFGGLGSSPVELHAIEVTQGIQNWKNAVTLVEERPTWVRVFLRSKEPSRTPVRLELTASGDAGTIGTIRPVFVPPELVSTSRCDPLTNDPVAPECDRNDVVSSYIFKLPDSWTAGTTDFLKVVVDGAEIECKDHLPIQQGTTECWEAVDFVPTTHPNIGYFGIGWSGHRPGDAAFQEAERQVRSTFPVAATASEYGESGSDLFFAPTTTFGMARVIRALGLQRFLDGCWGSCPAWYMGLLVDQPAGVTLDGLSDPFWNSAVAYVKRNDPENSIAHEMGHLAGRDHAGCDASQEGSVDPAYPYRDGKLWPPKSGDPGDEDSAYYGFDPYTVRRFEHYAREVGAGALRTIYQPATCDLMGYADATWPSDYTYEGIRARLESLYPTASNQIHGTEAWRFQRVIAGEPAMIVTGIINGEETAIEQLLQIPTPASFDLPLEGAATLVLEDAAGTQLRSYPVATSGVDGSFLMVVPREQEVAAVSLESGGIEVAHIEASATAPTVEIVSPAAGVVLERVARVEWVATDPDGDPLRFTVQYSPDNGASWKTVALDQEGSSVDIDMGFAEGSDGARLRVLATDGFHTTIAESGSFVVPTGPPDVVITAPSPNAPAAHGRSLVLLGGAHDKEDGSLGDSELVWSSDRGGLLGTGSSLLVDVDDLDTGRHEITLTATDSDGEQGTATTKITVYAGEADIPRCGGRTATKVGTKSGDTLLGTSLPDVIVGLGGGDRISGKGGKDALCGSGGRDRLTGGGGRDLLDGGGGRDTCEASGDRLKGCERRL